MAFYRWQRFSRTYGSGSTGSNKVEEVSRRGFDGENNTVPEKDGGYVRKPTNIVRRNRVVKPWRGPAAQKMCVLVKLNLSTNH